MINSINLTLGQIRILETDNNLILPFNKWIRLLVTSINVIHSWGIHTLGFKFDGIPGILNLVYLNFLSIGFFHGLCYELCGILHNFMSIRIKILVCGIFIDIKLFKIMIYLLKIMILLASQPYVAG